MPTAQTIPERLRLERSYSEPGPRWNVRLVTPIAFGWLVLVSAVAAAPPEDRVVTYTYLGHGEVDGNAAGQCTAFGVFFPADTNLWMATGGGTIGRALTWVNKTSVRPGHPEELGLSTPVDYARNVTPAPFPAGRIEIAGRRDSVIVFDVSGVAWAGAAEGVATAAHYYDDDRVAGPQTMFNGLGTHGGDYPRGARGWTFDDGTVRLSGAGVLHLRDVHIRGSGLDISLPRYRTDVHNATAPVDAMRVTSWRLEEAFVAFSDLALDWSGSGATLVCEDLEASVAGRLTVLQATGAAFVPRLQPFERQALEISGRFVIAEKPVNATNGWGVKARAEGDIEVVGIDFQEVLSDELVPGIGKGIGVGLGALLVGAVAKNLFPTLAALYTRLLDIDVGAHPLRRQILAVLAERPVIGEAALVTAVGASRGTVRHHTEVLVRSKRIRHLPLGGQTLYAAASTDAEAARMAFVRNDPRLRAVDEAFASGKARPEVTRVVADRLGVHSRTARKYVQKYLELGAESRSEGSP